MVVERTIETLEHYTRSENIPEDPAFVARQIIETVDAAALAPDFQEVIDRYVPVLIENALANLGPAGIFSRPRLDKEVFHGITAPKGLIASCHEYLRADSHVRTLKTRTNDYAYRIIMDPERSESQCLLQAETLLDTVIEQLLAANDANLFRYKEFLALLKDTDPDFMVPANMLRLVEGHKNVVFKTDGMGHLVIRIRAIKVDIKDRDQTAEVSPKAQTAVCLGACSVEQELSEAERLLGMPLEFAKRYETSIRSYLSRLRSGIHQVSQIRTEKHPSLEVDQAKLIRALLEQHPNVTLLQEPYFYYRHKEARSYDVIDAIGDQTIIDAVFQHVERFVTMLSKEESMAGKAASSEEYANLAQQLGLVLAEDRRLFISFLAAHPHVKAGAELTIIPFSQRKVDEPMPRTIGQAVDLIAAQEASKVVCMPYTSMLRKVSHGAELHSNTEKRLIRAIEMDDRFMCVGKDSYGDLIYRIGSKKTPDLDDLCRLTDLAATLDSYVSFATFRGYAPKSSFFDRMAKEDGVLPYLTDAQEVALFKFLKLRFNMLSAVREESLQAEFDAATQTANIDAAEIDASIEEDVDESLLKAGQAVLLRLTQEGYLTVTTNRFTDLLRNRLPTITGEDVEAVTKALVARKQFSPDGDNAGIFKIMAEPTSQKIHFSRVGYATSSPATLGHGTIRQW